MLFSFSSRKIALLWVFMCYYEAVLKTVALIGETQVSEAKIGGVAKW